MEMGKLMKAKRTVKRISRRKRRRRHPRRKGNMR